MLCGNADSFKTTFMVICNDNTTRRHFASTRYYGNSPLLSVMCVLCVIAQRLSIQPLGSLRWPAAEQKHRPQFLQVNCGLLVLAFVLRFCFFECFLLVFSRLL